MSGAAELLELARRSLRGEPLPPPAEAAPRPLWLTLRAADGRTKASVGTLAPTEAPDALVARLARQLHAEDPRSELAPLQGDDTLECCVGLSPRPIRAPDALAPGEAVIVQRAPYGGVLLPADADRAGFSSEARLIYACRLAGLAGDAWEEPETLVQALPVEVATAPVGNAGASPAVLPGEVP